MKFSKNLIIDKDIKRKEEISDLLQQNVGIYGIYLIIIPLDTSNIFEIIESIELYKPVYKNSNYALIGIAKDKDSARLIVLNILNNFRKTSEDFSNLKKYVLNMVN